MPVIRAHLNHVVGPTSATDNAIARFDATTGKIIQNSNATIDDAGNMVLSAGITVNAGRTNNDSVFHGQTLDNVIFLDADRNAVSMGTNITQYRIDGVNFRPTLAMLRVDSGIGINQVLWSNSNTQSRGPFNNFLRSRNSAGTDIIVQNGDVGGTFRSSAHDGTQFLSGAQIQFIVVGTPTLGLVRQVIRFATADGAGVVRNRMTLTEDGKLVIGNSLSSSSYLEVDGSVGLDVTSLNAATLTLDETMSSIMVSYTTTGAVTITLPTASSAFSGTLSIGRIYTIKDAGCNASVNNITIVPNGTDTIVTTIVADTSAVINGDGDSLTLQAISNTQFAII